MKWFSPQIIKFKNLDDNEVLSSDFPGLRNLSSLIDLSRLCNLSGLNSPISSKNFLVLVIFVEWIIKNLIFY